MFVPGLSTNPAHPVGRTAGNHGRFPYFTVIKKELQIFYPRTIMGVLRERNDLGMKRKKSLKGRAALAAALIALAAMAGVLGHCISRYSALLISRQQEQMLRIVRSVGGTVRTYIETEKELFAWEAGRSYGSGEELAGAMAEYLAMKPRARRNMLLLNGDGKVISNVKSSQEGVYCQADRFDFALPGTGEVLVPGAYIPQEGSCLIPVVTPVSVNGYDGPLYLAEMVDFADLDRAIDSAALKTDIKGYFVIKDQNGIILSHESREQVGLQAISGRLEHYPGLDISGMEQLIARQLSGEEGTYVYDSYWFSDDEEPRQAKKFSAFSPLAMDDGFWVISLTMDYDDFIGPYNQLLAESMVILAAIFICLGIGAWLLIRTGQRQRELLRQNQYLKELGSAVTELNQTREQAKHSERLQMVGIMTSGLSHEFNNILAPILGYSELLMGDLPDDCLSHSDAAEIYEAALRAKELVAQISSLSQKSADQAQYRLFDFEEALRKWIKSVILIKPEKITLVTRIHTDGAWVYGNPTQLYEVLLNLCVNAFYEMSAEGGLTLTASVVEAGELPEGLSPISLTGRFVLVRVQDTGGGISPEIIDNIFTPFFTTKKHGEGTGLGLAISQKILDEHQGDICVESRVGEGSSFYYCLPYHRADEERELSGPPAAPPEQEEREESARRLLVVDDDESTLRMIRRVLGKHGFRAEYFGSPREALAALEGGQEKYDMMITDYQMDEMNGVELAAQARFLNKNLKVLILSGLIKSEIVDACQKGRIDGYLLKPAQGDQLLQFIKNGKI